MNSQTRISLSRIPNPVITPFLLPPFGPWKMIHHSRCSLFVTEFKISLDVSQTSCSPHWKRLCESVKLDFELQHTRKLKQRALIASCSQIDCARFWLPTPWRPFSRDCWIQKHFSASNFLHHLGSCPSHSSFLSSAGRPFQTVHWFQPAFSNPASTALSPGPRWAARTLSRTHPSRRVLPWSLNARYPKSICWLPFKYY